jgi:autonomous glycyl radical cofactor GrcA
MTYTKEDLIAWCEELHDSLIACDPSASEDALDSFIEIQEEQECFSFACAAAGYTEDEIIDACN